MKKIFLILSLLLTSLSGFASTGTNPFVGLWNMTNDNDGDLAKELILKPQANVGNFAFNPGDRCNGGLVCRLNGMIYYQFSLTLKKVVNANEADYAASGVAYLDEGPTKITGTIHLKLSGDTVKLSSNDEGLMYKVFGPLGKNSNSVVDVNTPKIGENEAYNDIAGKWLGESGKKKLRKYSMYTFHKSRGLECFVTSSNVELIHQGYYLIGNYEISGNNLHVIFLTMNKGDEKGNIISVDEFEKEAVNYKYSISGDQLILKPDEGETVILHRYKETSKNKGNF